MVPSYLHEIAPGLIRDNSNYNLRNSNNFETLMRRTELFANSFIPSSVKIWNDLPLNLRESPTLSNFKSNLLNHCFKAPDVPKHYLFGNRRLSVLQTRLRNNCSHLNNDLHLNHLRETSDCECGYFCEDAVHFFFHCPRFSDIRLLLFRDTRPYHPLNISKILHGSDVLNYNENCDLVNRVHIYIKNSKRFDK